MMEPIIAWIGARENTDGPFRAEVVRDERRRAKQFVNISMKIGEGMS
jgi:hypothetical protein